MSVEMLSEYVVLNHWKDPKLLTGVCALETEIYNLRATIERMKERIAAASKMLTVETYTNEDYGFVMTGDTFNRIDAELDAAREGR